MQKSLFEIADVKNTYTYKRICYMYFYYKYLEIFIKNLTRSTHKCFLKQRMACASRKACQQLIITFNFLNKQGRNTFDCETNNTYN